MYSDVATSNGWIKGVGDDCITVTVSSEILSRSNNKGNKLKTTEGHSVLPFQFLKEEII